MGIEIKNKRDTRAGEYFDVDINGVTVHGCTYKSGTSTRGPYEFIAPPQRKGKDKDGNDKWYNVVSFSREVGDAILAAYRGEIVTDDFADDDIPY